MLKKLIAAAAAMTLAFTPSIGNAKTPEDLLPPYYSLYVDTLAEPVGDPFFPLFEAPELVLDDKAIVLNSHDYQQIKCMAENLYHEARGEPLAGQIAVNHVVINRTEDSRFPSTPCSVVKQRNPRGCQFSWVCTGTRGITNLQLYDHLFTLCTQVYYEKIADNTKEALFYHANYVKPRWSFKMQMTARYGAHIFYKG